MDNGVYIDVVIDIKSKNTNINEDCVDYNQQQTHHQRQLETDTAFIRTTSHHRIVTDVRIVRVTDESECNTRKLVWKFR